MRHIPALFVLVVMATATTSLAFQSRTSLSDRELVDEVSRTLEQAYVATDRLNYTDAERLFREAIDLMEERDHPVFLSLRATARMSLGTTLASMNQFESALEVTRQALADMEVFADWAHEVRHPMREQVGAMLTAGQSQLGMTLQQLGRFEEAIAAFRRALELGSKLPLTTNINMAAQGQSYFHMAEVLVIDLQDERALGMYEKALASVRRCVDDLPIQCHRVRCLDSIGVLRIQRGDQSGVEAFDRADAILKSVRRAGYSAHPEVIQASVRQAGLRSGAYLALGRTQEAATMIERITPMLNAAPFDLRVFIRMAQADAYLALGKLDEERAVRRSISASLPESGMVAETALAAAENELKLAQSIGQIGLTAEARHHLRLGVEYIEDLGDERAAQVLRAAMIGTEAAIADFMGDEPEARTLALRAMEELRSIKGDVERPEFGWAAASMVAVALSGVGERELADEAMEVGARWVKRLPDSPTRRWVLGQCYVQAALMAAVSGDPDAPDHVKRAAAWIEANPDPEGTQLNEAFLSLARVFTERRDDPAAALARSRELAAMMRDTPGGEALLGVNHGVQGILMLQAGPKHFREGAASLARSQRELWKNFSRNFASMPEHQKYRFFRERIIGTELIYTAVFHLATHEDPKAQPSDAHLRAGMSAALLHKGLLPELARREKAEFLDGADPEWIEMWDEYCARRAALASHAAQLSLSSLVATGSSLQRDSRHLDALERRLRSTNRAFDQSMAIELPSIKDVTDQLRAGEAWIDFVMYQPYGPDDGKLGSPRYGAFVLTADGRVTAHDLCSSADYVSLVTTWTDALAQAFEFRTEPNWLPLTAEAARLVWSPMTERLHGIKRVYVSPEGQLYRIPFECYRVQKNGAWRYLIEDVGVVYVPSGRSIRDSRTPTRGHTVDVRVFADPHYNASADRRRKAWTDRQELWTQIRRQGESESVLPSGGNAPYEARPVTRELAEHVTKWFGEASVQEYLGPLASEEAFRQVEPPDILVIATHGEILPLSPEAARMGWQAWFGVETSSRAPLQDPMLRCRLALAGANSSVARQAVGRSTDAGDADGLVSGYELSSMDLRGIELAVLVACEGALSEQIDGEGVHGLARAMWIAGARSVVASVWPIAAGPSVEQMGAFITANADTHKLPDYAAFRQAQLEALEQHGHPFWWAGLVYIGDPGD